MPFVYQRPIRFQETDAAGVMYFANVLNLCHEAYEESLRWAGIDLKRFFSGDRVAVPITHTSVDYRAPSFCGDIQVIHLLPQPISESSFEINYEIFSAEEPSRLLSQALTRHVCIQTCDRKRMSIPEFLVQWMEKCR